MFLMTTHFPLAYRKLLPLGSPPRILETPRSTWGRLANTFSAEMQRGVERESGRARADRRPHLLLVAGAAGGGEGREGKGEEAPQGLCPSALAAHLWARGAGPH